MRSGHQHLESIFLVLACASLAAGQSAGTFTATGSMITPRFGHMSILLPDGKVLIAGGQTTCFVGPPVPCATASSAELYDPAAGTFSAAGLMTTTPVLGAVLPDGRVLFAGNNLTHTQVMVEIYDPAAGTFTVTGVSQTLIGIYSAALLRDGRALLNGWTSSGSGAEFYDPVTATFAPAVINWPPGMGGIGYPLAVLVDGRVLFDTPGLYDPAAGTFNLVSGLPYLNDDPASTVLINGQVLLTGGNADFGNVNQAWLFDPAAATFSATGNMTMPRDGHTSTLLSDGTVLIAGSLTVTTPATIHVWTGTTSTEIYDPAAASFSYAAPMLTPRFSHSAVLLNSGQVLITGGGGNTEGGPTITLQGIGNAEIYTPAEPSPAPALFSLSGDGQGQAAIWHATTGTLASANNPAVAGEVLSMYTTSLVENGVVPPKVSVGGMLAETLYFGDAPGYPGYNQVNFRVPSGVSLGPAVAVWLSYLGRYSNTVTIGVQ
jgi:hypothetical protein